MKVTLEIFDFDENASSENFDLATFLHASRCNLIVFMTPKDSERDHRPLRFENLRGVCEAEGVLRILDEGLSAVIAREKGIEDAE